MKHIRLTTYETYEFIFHKYAVSKALAIDRIWLRKFSFSSNTQGQSFHSNQ